MKWHYKDCQKRHIGCRKDCETWKADCEAAEAEKKRIREATSQDRITSAYFKMAYKNKRPRRKPHRENDR